MFGLIFLFKKKLLSNIIKQSSASSHAQSFVIRASQFRGTPGDKKNKIQCNLAGHTSLT